MCVYVCMCGNGHCKEVRERLNIKIFGKTEEGKKRRRKKTDRRTERKKINRVSDIQIEREREEFQIDIY